MPLFARGGKNRMNLSLSFSLLRLQEVLEGVNECKRNVSVLSLLLPFLVTVDLSLLFRPKSFDLPYYQVSLLKERREMHCALWHERDLNRTLDEAEHPPKVASVFLFVCFVSLYQVFFCNKVSMNCCQGEQLHKGFFQALFFFWEMFASAMNYSHVH